MSFDGTWKITIVTPMGDQHAQLELKQDGAAISGTASQGGESAPLIDPSLDGDRIRWSQDIKKPMPMTVKFDLTRTGDTLQGTAKAGFFLTANVTGTRG
jgi:hypothetical protein